MASPHDSLFKATFSQPGEAAALLAAVLPKSLSSRVEWSTLTLETPESVDAAFDRRQADLVFRATLRGGRQARLLLVFEHQSRVDPLMPVRLLGYMTRVWERSSAEAPKEPLPVVVPVVLYHGDRAWTAARSLGALFELDESVAAAVRPFLPDFSFALDDLTRLSEAGLRARGLPPWATVALALFAWCRNAAHPERVLGRWLEELRRLAQSDARDSALTAVAQYLLRASAGRPEAMKVLFAQLGDGTEDFIVTPEQRILQRGRAEGRQEGRNEGRQAGRQEALANLLLTLLTNKFGPPPASVRERIAQASEEQLTQWSVRVLTAQTLQDAVA